jgi:hypothetical protein
MNSFIIMIISPTIYNNQQQQFHYCWYYVYTHTQPTMTKQIGLIASRFLGGCIEVISELLVSPFIIIHIYDNK